MAFVKSLAPDAGPPEVFKTYPKIYRPWSVMSQELMNGPSELSSAVRELLLAFAAGVAGCAFVFRAHSEVAIAWGIERQMIEDLLHDVETAPIDPRLKPLFRFARKLVLYPAAMEQADADATFAEGWSEDTFHDVVAIVGRMRFMQAMAEGYGFKPFSLDFAAEHARRRVKNGYVSLYPFFEKP